MLSKNCSRGLGGSGMLVDANSIEGGSLNRALMAGEPGGKGALWVPRAESSEEEVTGIFGMVLSLETKMMTHQEKAPSPISSNFGVQHP